ncbi:MAG: hypothetical protein KDJ36_18800, partial [Hyphomicrobiaceae bacterium]|nr:hypothetical protein [Hyphomicrobiaceae bacterium]
MDGVFEAFAVSLSAFGASIVDVGPLIRHAHTLVDFDLGSVFKRTFDLSEQQVPLASFLLFDQMNDGVTADTAYSTSPTAIDNVSELTGVIVQPETSVWFSSEMIGTENEMEFFSELDVQVTGTAVVESLQMTDPTLVVTSTGVGQFHITGFTPELLNERSTALFALSFSSGGEATVRTTRSAPMTLSSDPSETENTGNISADDLELAGVTATISLDIDQDGIATPLTDGILLMRYLEGMRGDDLVRGAVNLPAIVAHDRTGRTPAEIETQLPDDIVAYIENVLIKSFLTDSADPSSIRNTLDLDNSGGAPDINDGELLARYMAGFTSGSLTNGLSSADPASVLSFIETGRISARDINLAAFGEIISETGEDVLGLEGVGQADNSDGSSASGAVDPMVLAGASPEFAMDGNLVMAGGLPSAYEYFLDQYGQMTMFEEVYLDGELISRVAEGSPLDFGSDQYASLINSGNSGELTKVTGSALLGTEEPIFVRSPDAVGYEYEALSDHLFT